MSGLRITEYKLLGIVTNKKYEKMMDKGIDMGVSLIAEHGIKLKKILLTFLSFILIFVCSCDGNIFDNIKLNKTNVDLFETLDDFFSLDEISISKLDLYYSDYRQFYEIEFTYNTTGENYHNAYLYCNYDYLDYLTLNDLEFCYEHDYSLYSEFLSVKEEKKHKEFTESEIKLYIKICN